MLLNFYTAVLTQSGHYFLFTLPMRAHIWASSIEELVTQTEARLDQQGIYFAVESFQTADSREQANVLALRSLRLDIDAGSDKFGRDPQGAYETRSEALAALRGFFAATTLMPSFIVSSGEGWHIYYCLDEDLTPEQWLPLARGLGVLGVDNTLRVDTSVTCDWARVLRPLGTLHKNGARVRLVADTGVRYSAAQLASSLPVAVVKPRRVFDMSVNTELDLKVEGPPKSIHKILEHCGAMQNVNSAKGDVPEPYWRAMLGVVKYTVQGVDGAHDLSRGHPDYDPQDTERKFNAWTTGPTTCVEFAKHTNACADCTHNGKIKSPIMLGLMTRRSSGCARQTRIAGISS